MTVGELKAKLNEYGDHMEVKVEWWDDNEADIADILEIYDGCQDYLLIRVVA